MSRLEREIAVLRERLAQLEQGERLDSSTVEVREGFAGVREGFASIHTGMVPIVALVTTIERDQP